jgi:DNA (cytosine-5)-methyltransferase 1
VAGYKMIGNAVPVKMAEVLGRKILDDLKSIKPSKKIAANGFADALNGNLVREKMNEIVNSITV